MTCCCFCLWDEDFGPAFLKVCDSFPYPAKIWVNGHERAKRHALKAGIAFTALSNGFASCTAGDHQRSRCAGHGSASRITIFPVRGECYKDQPPENADRRKCASLQASRSKAW